MDELLEIREASPQDADAIALLFHDTIRRVNIADYSAVQIEAWAGPAPEPEKWRARMKTRQTFVASRRGEIVGFAEFEVDGHVDAVYVHHEHQREGVATRLLERIELAAERAAVTRLYTEASITARPFFERRGFVVVQPQEVEYRGLVFRNFKMEKPRHRRSHQNSSPPHRIEP